MENTLIIVGTGVGKGFHCPFQLGQFLWDVNFQPGPCPSAKFKFQNRTGLSINRKLRARMTPRSDPL